MNLKKIVIHELIKEQGVTEAELKFSDHWLDVTEERRINLVTKLVESFRGKQNLVGYSGFDNKEIFPKTLDKYLVNWTDETDPSDEEFYLFSQDACKLLHDKIKDNPPAKGGYIVFAEYVYQQFQFVGIFIIRDTLGELVKAEGGVLDIINVRLTDTDKLAMAASINITKYVQDDKKPLMMINKRNQEVSKYFATWLGSKDRETSENYTELFHQVIAKIPPPTDPESADLKRIDVNEVRRKIYDIVENNRDKTANLRVISLQIYNDEDVIPNYIHEKNIQLPSEFKTYYPSMKKMIEVKARKEGLVLQFSRNDYEKKKIRFEDGNKVIIKSKAIYDEIRNQLGAIADVEEE